jgi:hypothetical protein
MEKIKEGDSVKVKSGKNKGVEGKVTTVDSGAPFRITIKTKDGHILHGLKDEDLERQASSGDGHTTYVTRMDAITALKKKFTSNNPASWGRLSDRKLSEYYAENILGDKTKEVKIGNALAASESKHDELKTYDMKNKLRRLPLLEDLGSLKEASPTPTADELGVGKPRPKMKKKANEAITGEESDYMGYWKDIKSAAIQAGANELALVSAESSDADGNGSVDFTFSLSKRDHVDLKAGMFVEIKMENSVDESADVTIEWEVVSNDVQLAYRKSEFKGQSLPDFGKVLKDEIKGAITGLFSSKEFKKEPTEVTIRIPDFVKKFAKSKGVTDAAGFYQAYVEDQLGNTRGAGAEPFFAWTDESGNLADWTK